MVRTPLKCYVSPTGSEKIMSWLSKLNSQPEEDGREVLGNLQKLKPTEWVFPKYRASLRGYVKIGEIRWESDKTQYRILGYFKSGNWIALIGCTHKGSRYNPTDALSTAEERRQYVESGSAKFVDYED